MTDTVIVVNNGVGDAPLYASTDTQPVPGVEDVVTETLYGTDDIAGTMTHELEGEQLVTAVPSQVVLRVQM